VLGRRFASRFAVRRLADPDDRLWGDRTTRRWSVYCAERSQLVTSGGKCDGSKYGEIGRKRVALLRPRLNDQNGRLVLVRGDDADHTQRATRRDRDRVAGLPVRHGRTDRRGLGRRRKSQGAVGRGRLVSGSMTRACPNRNELRADIGALSIDGETKRSRSRFPGFRIAPFAPRRPARRCVRAP
jgi:hypothetical protein